MRPYLRWLATDHVRVIAQTVIGVALIYGAMAADAPLEFLMIIGGTVCITDTVWTIAGIASGHDACDDAVEWFEAENDRLHNENSELAAQGDHLQDRIDKLEDENSDLNGRIQDLGEQRIETEPVW